MFASRDNGGMYANGNQQGRTSNNVPRWSDSMPSDDGQRPLIFPTYVAAERDNYYPPPPSPNSVYTTLRGEPAEPVNPQSHSEQTSWYNHPSAWREHEGEEQTSWYNKPYACCEYEGEEQTFGYSQPYAYGEHEGGRWYTQSYAWSEHELPQCSTDECIDDDGVAQMAIKTAFRVLVATNDEFRQSMALRGLSSQSDRNPVDDFYDEWIKEQEEIGERIRELPDSELEALTASLPKTPPESPPPKLARFPSSQTLEPEQAPEKPEARSTGRGQKNIEILQKLREKDAAVAGACEDDLNTVKAPSPTAPTKDIAETLKRQAHRRRKQVHDERAGLSAPEEYKDRARRRHETHSEVKKNQKASPPPAADAPDLPWSRIDEEKVALFALEDDWSKDDPFALFTREEVRKILEQGKYTGENVLGLINAIAELEVEQKRASLGGRTLFEHDTDSMRARVNDLNVVDGSDSQPRHSTASANAAGSPEALLCNMSGMSYIDDRGPPMQSHQPYVEDASESGLEIPRGLPRPEAITAAEGVDAPKHGPSAHVINDPSHPVPSAFDPSYDADKTGHHGLRRRPESLDKSTASLYRTPLKSSEIERGNQHGDEGKRKKTSAERRKERRRERRTSDRDRSSRSHSVNEQVASPQLSTSSDPHVFTGRGLRRSLLHAVTAEHSPVNPTSEEAQRAAVYLEHLKSSFASMQSMAYDYYMWAQHAEHRAAMLEQHNTALNTRVLMAEAGVQAWAREAKGRAEAIEELEVKVKELKDERRRLRSEVEGLKETVEAGWWAQENRRDNGKGDKRVRLSKESRESAPTGKKSPEGKDVRRKSSREEKERVMRDLKDEVHALKKQIKKLKIKNDDVLEEVKRKEEARGAWKERCKIWERKYAAEGGSPAAEGLWVSDDSSK